MGITLTSLGRPPGQMPLAGEKQANTLLLIVSNQTQFVANDWAKLTNSSAVFDPPTAAAAGAKPIFPELPYPLVITEGQASGELKGSYWMMMSVRDALTVCSFMTESPPPGDNEVISPDPDQVDAIRELFNIYCGSADRAMCKGVDERVHLKQVSTRLVQSAADAALPPVRPGWLIELKMKVGDRPVTIWELIPQGLGGDIVEYYRDELATQVSVVCGGRADPPSRIGIKGKILVVDPVPSIQNTIKQYLEKEGFELIAVDSANQAVYLTGRECPRAVIQEYSLPDMGGLDLCKAIREKYSKEDLPILFVTTRSSRQDIIQAVQAGATQYIMKPFTRETLVAKVMEATRQKAGVH